jgi:hypothetical protein
MESFRYYILPSNQKDKFDFSCLPGYCTWESTRKSIDESLFLIKWSDSDQLPPLNNIEPSWGPFDIDQIDIILLEPTWKKNIFLMN